MENINIEKFLMNANESQLTEFIEKANQKKRKSLDKRVAELENWRKQAGAEIKILRNDNIELKQKYDKLIEEFNKLEAETNQVTNTLIIHGIERRTLEKYIHNLVYKEIGKNTLRDKLFHGILTRKCKYHLSESLSVASFNWINVEDVKVAEKLSMKYLNKVTIHNLMQKKAIELQKSFNKLEDKNKELTDKEIKQKNILELLIEECGGDFDEI